MKILSIHTLVFALSAALLTTACKEKKIEPAPVPVISNAMTYRLSGQAVTATSVTASNSSNILSVTGITSPQSLTILLPNPTTSGTISNGTISYSLSGAAWSASPGLAGSTSTIELTELNTVARKASGTFSATLQATPGTPATGTKTVADGSFTNVSF
ncbi:MAG: hypothetical protein H7330_05325 [Hymenobacteraceae bacterium]|nr:hypothetical protein [Hymenobacteraceae bacterium]